MSDEKPLSPSDIRSDEVLIEKIRAGSTEDAALLQAMRDNARRPS